MAYMSWNSSNFSYTNHTLPGSPTFSGGEVCTSEMYGGRHLPLNTDGDSGGGFTLVKKENFASYVSVPHVSNCALHGDVRVSHRTDGLISQPDPSLVHGSQMMSWGTTAIARCSPTNPNFSLSTLLGEVKKDGLPSLIGTSFWKERTQVARAAGKEYLNSEFGWQPLLRDIQGFFSAVKQSGDLLDQYRKDSGKKIRRGYRFPTSSHTSASPLGFMPFFPSTTGAAVGWRGMTIQSYSEEIWFSGAFKYHIPVSSTQLGKFSRWVSLADHAFGVKPTPEVIWNLAPWSWAVDWFSNTGDVMTNISNLGRDGMVMQYGYIMCERKKVTQSYGTALSTADPRFKGKTSTYITRSKTAQRDKATPYGFGINLDTLSPNQIAVLAALGLSRT